MPRKRKQDGGGPVTLQDIADRCGVSRITASCALRGDRKSVSQPVMDRIVQAAREMGYDPTLTLAARRLKYQHSPRQVENHLVALFFPLFTERYWTLIFEGINRILQEARYGLLLSTVDGRSPDFGNTLPYVFRRGEVDGVLIFAREDSRELVRGLDGEPGFGRRPVVGMAQRIPGYPAVLVDDGHVGRLAAGHLLDQGHRHLLCFHQPDYGSDIIRRRVEGYAQALRERGLDPEVHLHHAPWVWDDPRGLDPALAEVVAAHPRVTGVMFPNDNFGITASRALVRLGLRIPRDLSVVGVDDSDEWTGADDRNIWTTVRLPLRDLGAESSRLLLRQIRDGGSPETTVILPVELVVRGSTAPLARNAASS